MQLKPIGIIKSGFKEKFGVPRQSLMVPEARAILKLDPDPRFKTALQQLDTFSHVWVIFGFHLHLREDWTPTIQPPRLGPGRVGVFASRSPDRPNPIGMSAVRLERIDYEAPGGIEIHLSGVDLLDETPVYDLKPYVPYADAIPHASGGWARQPIPRFRVTFAEGALQQARPGTEKLVSQILEWDPRPLSQRKAMPIEEPAHEGKEFAFRLGDDEVRWRIRGGGIEVLTVGPFTAEVQQLRLKRSQGSTPSST